MEPITLTRREAMMALRCALIAAMDERQRNPGPCPWCGQAEGHADLCGGAAALRLADRMLEQEPASLPPEACAGCPDRWLREADSDRMLAEMAHDADRMLAELAPVADRMLEDLAKEG